MKCEGKNVSLKAWRLLDCRKKALFNFKDKSYCLKHFDKEKREIKLAKRREYQRLLKLTPKYIERFNRLKKEKALVKKLEEKKKLDDYWKRFPIKETSETYLKELKNLFNYKKDTEKNYLESYGELRFLELLKHNYRFDCSWNYRIEIIKPCKICTNHMPLRMLISPKKICPFCIRVVEVTKLNKPNNIKFSVRNSIPELYGGSI